MGNKVAQKYVAKKSGFFTPKGLTPKTSKIILSFTDIKIYKKIQFWNIGKTFIFQQYLSSVLIH